MCSVGTDARRSEEKVSSINSVVHLRYFSIGAQRQTTLRNSFLSSFFPPSIPCFLPEQEPNLPLPTHYSRPQSVPLPSILFLFFVLLPAPLSSLLSPFSSSASSSITSQSCACSFDSPPQTPPPLVQLIVDDAVKLLLKPLHAVTLRQPVIRTDPS